MLFPTPSSIAAKKKTQPGPGPIRFRWNQKKPNSNLGNDPFLLPVPAVFFDHRRGRFWASPRTIRRALTMGKHEMCKKKVRVRILKDLRCENGRKVFPKYSKTIFINNRGTIREIKTNENFQFIIKYVLQSTIYFFKHLSTAPT